jgi:hypothetical protein
MLWTAIGYTKNEPFIQKFYGSHDGNIAIHDARRIFNNDSIFAVIAGDHISSVYLYQPEV